MIYPAQPRTDLERPLAVRLLRCPACGESSPQKLVNPRRVRVLSVPDRPFARAFAWVEGTDAPAGSPLHHGLCLCPECRYPALPTEFGAGQAVSPDEAGALRRIFVDQTAGLRGPLARLLGSSPELDPPAQRAVRVTLAALAAQQLRPDRPARGVARARLHARLVWLYLEEMHLVWREGPRTTLSAWADHGPGFAAFDDCRAALGAARSVWPEIPLEESMARASAVNAQEEVCRTAARILRPEHVVEETRRLAVLQGLNGDAPRAAATFDHAIDLSTTAGAQAFESYRDGRIRGLSPEELRPFAESAHLLGRLAAEIDREAREAVPRPPRRIPKFRLPGAVLRREPDELPRDFGIFG